MSLSSFCAAGKSWNCSIASCVLAAMGQSSQWPCNEPLPEASSSPLLAAKMQRHPKDVRDAATPSLNQFLCLAVMPIGCATASGEAPKMCSTNKRSSSSTTKHCPTGSLTTRSLRSSYDSNSGSAVRSRLISWPCVKQIRAFLLSAMLGVQNMIGDPQKSV